MKFNRICHFIALLWLLISVPIGMRLRPTMPDFGQFFVGGIIAQRGEWKSLYPIPVRRSRDNAGLVTHSNAKPLWLAISKEHDVADFTHFILPPPSALLFIPFAWMSYAHAYWTWMFLLCLCTWGAALTAAHLYRTIHGSPSRTEGLLSLLIVFSPMTARAIRVANVSPPIALILGFAILALLADRKSVRGVGAIVLGALLKYATLVLLPLVVAMRRWRMLLAASALGLLLLVVTWVAAGTAPFVEFFTKISPTLSRPSAYLGNQSLPGLLARVFGRPLDPPVVWSLNAARFLTLGAILSLIFAQRRDAWLKPINVVAAAALLMSWLLIFSPIAWEHWPIFLCPVWGWLLWEARDPGLRGGVAIGSLALMYFPAGILQVRGFLTYQLTFPEPFNSWQLWGVSLLFGLAAWRLTDSLRQANHLPLRNSLRWGIWMRKREIQDAAAIPPEQIAATAFGTEVSREKR